MMAADENFQAHIFKLMKMAVVWWVAPDCNNLCDCGRAVRRWACGVCGGKRIGGGWRSKQPAGLTTVCELWSPNFGANVPSGERKQARLVGGALSFTCAKIWEDFCNKISKLYTTVIVYKSLHAITTDKVCFASAAVSHEEDSATLL